MALTQVKTTGLADDAVTSAKIADDAIAAAGIADNAVVTAGINADAVTGAKIADDAIDSEHYTDGSIDTAHIADDQVTLAKMAGLARGKLIYGDSSGNPAALTVGSANQVLTADGTDVAWAAVSGGDNTPSWLATSNADQSISSGTWTKITNLGTEEWDTDNGFASNGYTVPSGQGGRYCIFFGIRFPAMDSGETMLAEVKVNDDGVDWSDIQFTSGNTDQNLQGNGSFIVTLAAGDVVEMNVYHNEGGSINAPGSKNTFLGGFKLA